MKDLPYRHHEFYLPHHSCFSSITNIEDLWPALVGETLIPIIESGDFQYWFCFHGLDYQFCFAAENYEEIEKKIEEVKKELQFENKIYPTEGDTVFKAFAGSRWIAEDRLSDPALTARRSKLVFNYLHSVSELFVDNLRCQDSVWSIERNSDGQNPLGNSFESLAHLLANISRFEFRVSQPARTDWMSPESDEGLICHL